MVRLIRAISLATLVLLLAAGSAAAQVPIPAPQPGSPDQNIFYGAVPPMAEHAPVVLFVHGLRGNASDWWIRNDMFKAVYAAGYRSAYLSLNADNSRNDAPIEANATVLKALLPKVLAHYDASQVFVVAHSKGGVDVQAAMLDANFVKKLRALIMLSTPNQGTELADWAFGPGRPIADGLGLLGPGVEAMKTSTMALFRSVADPILKKSGVPMYTIAGDRFINDPLTIPTGAVLKSLVPDQANDGFVTIPRTRLSFDFSVDLGEVPTDHYHTNNGTAVWPKVHAQIVGTELMMGGFKKIASNGFNEFGGSPSNAWGWTMKWFRGKLYVGTGREQICTTLLANDVQTGTRLYGLAVLDELCPTLEEYPDRLRAEIWEFTPDTKEWKRVFQSPATILVNVNQDGSPKFSAREMAFRGMAVFEEADGTEALYVGAVTAGAVYGNLPPYSTGQLSYPPPRLLRSLDGQTWTPVPQVPGTFLGDIGEPQPGGTRKIVSFRALTPYKGKLFATVSDYRGVGQIIVSSNPSAGNNAWTMAAPVLEEFPAWNLHVFNDYLYVTTGDAFLSPEGYGVYKTDAEGTPPYSYTTIIANGAWQANQIFRSTQGLSFMDFKGQLYVGTNRPTELIRVNPDDTWDLIVGEPRFTPQGLKRPLSGLGIGFGSWFNGHFWRMGNHDGYLYLGTWDWSVGLKGLTGLDRLFGYQYGFDLYRTDDGIHWTALSKTGLGDGYNYGGRAFESTPAGLFISTARQRGGLQVFQGPFAPATPPAIAAPQRLESESETTTGRTVVLHWDAVPGAARYRIYRATVKPFNELLGGLGTFSLPGSDTELSLEDVQDGALDEICPGELGETTMCAAVQSIKATVDPQAVVLPMAFPLPWALVGVTANPAWSEAAPTSLQSLYFIRAEDPEGNLSEPSNFVGGPGKGFVTPPATPAPTVTPSQSPLPNENGWNNTDVTVSWTIATPGSGMLASEGCEAVTVTAEGETTLTCSVTNSAGQTTEESVTIRIDRTAPTVDGSRTPAANAAGWNNTAVTVTFECRDAGSGIATCGSAPVILSAEAMGLSTTAEAVDLAGNIATATVDGINIDLTPPALTAVFDTPPNAAGWNNTDVTISFIATDALSQVATVSAPVLVTTEGAGQVVNGGATDRAGNAAAVTVTVNVDKTAPEALMFFSVLAGDLIVRGVDEVAGVPPGPVTPTIRYVRAKDDDDCDDDGHTRIRLEGWKGLPQERTYTIADLAGNTLVVVGRARGLGRGHFRMQIESLQYNGGNAIAAPPNQLKFEWAFARGEVLKAFQQNLSIGRGRSHVHAEGLYDRKTDQTRVSIEGLLKKRLLAGLFPIPVITQTGTLLFRADDLT